MLGVVLAIVAAAESVASYYATFNQTMEYVAYSFMNQFAEGAYTLWMPMSVMRSIPNLFFFLAPLLVGLAWSWSWRGDVTSGYAALVLARTTRCRWLCAKTVAAFVAGGAVVAVPLLVNLVLVFCCVPAYQPDITDVVYTGLWTKVFLSELLYTCPAAYVAVRFVLDGVMAGLWATTVLGISYWARNRVAIVALPYLILIMIKYVSESLYALTGSQWGSLTILDQLKARGDAYYYGIVPVVIGIAVMVSVSLVAPVLAARRDAL